MSKDSHSEGYVVEIEYGNYFYENIAPNYLHLLMLLHGKNLPLREKDEPFRYLELGYGQGISLNVFASSQEGDFWGTDFNVEHTLSAKKALESTTVGATLLNDSFQELEARAQRGELPQFDMIILHGIWSWINEENRQHITRIISSNLKEGGICYISYNCLPGWANLMPLRDLMSSYIDYAQDIKGIQDQAQHAYNIAATLEKAGAEFFKTNPQATRRLKKLANASISYAAHEYFNEDSKPFYFKDVAKTFASMNCSFLCPTDLHNHLPNFIPPDIASLLKTIPDIGMSETIRDFTYNTTFRRDLFIKNGNTQRAESIQEKLGAMPIILARPIEEIGYEVQGFLPFTLEKKIYGHILEFLTKNNYAPKTIQEICAHSKSINIPQEGCLQIIRILLSFFYILPYQEPSERIRKNCKTLNAYFCERAKKGPYSTVLASPVTGGGVQVSRVDQLILNARSQGKTTPTECAEYIYVTLKKNGESINDLGKDLNTPESIHFLEKAFNLLMTRLPHLQRMGI